MDFNYIKFKLKKYSICVLLREFLVYFRKKHQHNVTLRSSEEEFGKVIKFENIHFHLQ